MALVHMDSLWLLLNASFGFAIALVLVRVIAFISELQQHRSLISKLEKEGKPMPPHSSFFGHLLEAKIASDELPSGAHSSYIIERLSRKQQGPDAFYFDNYPIITPMLALRDPDLASQAISHPWTGSEKPRALSNWFAPISGRGGINLFTENGEEWKYSHNMFLAFFSNNNLDAVLSSVAVNQMLTFRDMLRRETERRELIRLEPFTLQLMGDIIGHVVFKADLGNQTSGPHPLSGTMLRQLGLKFSTNNVMDNLGQLNPFRSLQIWNNGRVLDKHIRAQMGKRIDAFRSGKAQDEEGSFDSLLDRALVAYYSQPGRLRSDPVDSESMALICAQLRLFFFAGYDSTSSSMIALCYLIWKRPEVLAKLRAEHDEVFGRNVAACPDIIIEKPSVLNSLSYTNAVIKEALRLFPPANGIRMGCKDLVLKGRDGTEYPTEGVLVQMCHYSILRNPKIWARPLEFLPERFLVGPDHELYPPKGSWRPFEFGVRNCTGQSFVMKELKAFLAIMAREFDFEECYSEVYGGEKIDLTNVDHEIAYMTEAGSARLRGQFPCRVSLSGYASRV